MLVEKAARRAAFFWLVAAVAVLAAYVMANDPLRYAATRLQPLAFAAIVLAACCGFGWLARAPDLLTAAGAGCGIFGAIAFMAALAHALRPAMFIGMIAAGVVAFIPAIRQVRIVKPPASAGWIILAVVFALILPFVLAPDVSTDALEYHLLVPKLILAQNGIHALPLLVESNYPSLAEYDYLPFVGFGDPIAAKAFHFLCALLVLFTIGRLTRLIIPEADGVLGAALFFSMPVAALTSGWAWNDMLFTLFVLLSITHLIERRFVWSGVLFGFATWTKYTFVLASIGVAAILMRGLVQRWWRWRDVVRFASPVVLIAAIWMTKNALLTGNPVLPFLNGVFHSPYWSEASDRYFRQTLTGYEIPQWHWWSPLQLMLRPRIIDVHTGVLPLILLPLLFWSAAAQPPLSKRQQAAAVQTTYIMAIVLGWLLIRTEARSLLTLFAVLSAVYAANIERLRGWRVIVGSAVAMNVVIMLVTTQIVTDPVRHFLGLESREQYIVRMDPKQDAYRWLDTQPAVRSVLLVGLHDPYYLQKPAIFSSCCDQPVAQYLVQSNALPQLAARGITHIAFRPKEYERENAQRLYSWTPAQRGAFESFLRERCRPLARVGDVIIFRLL